MIKIVIFDFDGTLADTFDLIFAITNDLSVEFG
ncbi:MAG: HAD hydrolase-like protein, partial [Okeania sp. SIO3B3]|nr:HAD hydrolase-like protein [Okeania sp. SIO3B3]